MGHWHHRGRVGREGGLYRQTRDQVRLRRWQQQGTPRLRLADRESDDDRHGCVDDADMALTAAPSALLRDEMMMTWKRSLLAGAAAFSLVPLAAAAQDHGAHAGHAGPAAASKPDAPEH